MPYITIPQSPIYHQLTLDEILSGAVNLGIVRTNETNTRTFFTYKRGDKLYKYEDIADIIQTLSRFTAKYADLYAVDRQTLYHKFYIPKRSGGLREINAPLDPLMNALRELKDIFENKCHALYHTSAMAYMKGRGTIDAVKRHQQNNSHWFLKVDFHDFFGSTTKEFTMNTLKQIVPFNLVCEYPSGMAALERAVDLCFLNGGLPQGTPISPMLTNLLMIPVDYKLSKKLRNFNGQQFVYTRYADDMLISSLRDFKPAEIQQLIRDVLAECNAPYTFKEEKTRYGSRSGSNWNLGVMLNKDNNITVGHKKKKYFRAILTNYILDKQHDKNWSVEDVAKMNGMLSYYKMVEREYFDGLIDSMNSKYNVNLSALIKADLAI